LDYDQFMLYYGDDDIKEYTPSSTNITNKSDVNSKTISISKSLSEQDISSRKDSFKP